MPRRLNVLEQVRVAQPCAAEWDTMQGNDQVRFCEHCAKHVHNLSAMTPARALRLVEESNGKICVRYYARRDGAPQTYKSGLTLPGPGARRVARLATSAFSAVLSLSAHAAAQTTTLETFAPLSSAAIRTDSARRNTTATGGATLTGIVNAEFWDGIARKDDLRPANGARVRLLDRANNIEIKGFTNETGEFTLSDVPSGTYRLLVKASGYERHKEEITLTGGEARQVNVKLRPIVIISGAIGSRYQEETANPLVKAIEAKNLAKVRKVLAKHSNLVNVADAYGTTPLMLAISEDSQDIVQLLLEAGAQPNQPDRFGRTVLMRLPEDATPELAQLLLLYGANVNYRRPDDQATTLMLAVQYAKPNVIKVLLQAGAELNAYDDEGKTALMRAAAWKNWEVVKLLLESGGNLNTRDDAGHAALEYAARTGDITSVKMLVEAGADATSVDENGNAAWQLTPYDAAPEMIDFWLTAKVDLEHRNDEGQTWLHLLVTSKAEYVQALLQAGADINARDNHGATPLMLASSRNGLTTVQVLLEAGADLTLRDNNGKTALSYVGNYGNGAEIRQLLLAHGAGN